MAGTDIKIADQGISREAGFRINIISTLQAY
jgi:hypothetical protein